MGIFPNFEGENKQYLGNHHLVIGVVPFHSLNFVHWPTLSQSGNSNILFRKIHCHDLHVSLGETHEAS